MFSTILAGAIGNSVGNFFKLPEQSKQEIAKSEIVQIKDDYTVEIFAGIVILIVIFLMYKFVK
jgi:hypothetical protein